MQQADLSVPAMVSETAPPFAPAGHGQRWTAQRKMAVLEALASGVVSLSVLQSDYGISESELREWHYAVEKYGFDGLKLKHKRPRRQSFPPRRAPSWFGGDDSDAR